MPKQEKILLPERPTAEDLAELFRQLTGREPSPKDIEAAQATLAAEKKKE